MVKYEITGWKPEFNKIKFNKLLRENGKYSLSMAKGIVDNILEGQIVFVEVEEKTKDIFFKEAIDNFLNIREI